MASFKKDYEMGTKNENPVLIKLNEFFDDNIIKSTEPFCKFDYKGNQYYYELKTRNNTYKKYPTTLIPYSKLIKGKEHLQKFVFSFTDGLYYIDYNKELFDTFDLLDYKRNKRIDFNDRMQLYYFIPINHLIKIN